MFTASGWTRESESKVQSPKSEEGPKPSQSQSRKKVQSPRSRQVSSSTLDFDLGLWTPERRLEASATAGMPATVSAVEPLNQPTETLAIPQFSPEILPESPENAHITAQPPDVFREEEEVRSEGEGETGSGHTTRASAEAAATPPTRRGAWRVRNPKSQIPNRRRGVY